MSERDAGGGLKQFSPPFVLFPEETKRADFPTSAVGSKSVEKLAAGRPAPRTRPFVIRGC
jgi:hypothetical protein